MPITKEQVRATMKAMLAVADTIRECHERGEPCPGSSILLALQERGGTIEDYQAIVKTLENAGLIRDRGATLEWIGGTK